MPHQGKVQQAPEEHKKARPEEQFVPEQRFSGMPNSLMTAVPMAQPGTPNSVMREMDADDSGALFRGRGFDPTVGAHELSHTVRRESAPSGTIQRVYGNSAPAGSGFSGSDFIVTNLNLLNQVKKPFVGRNFKMSIDALNSKIALEKDPQEKQRLTAILDEAKDVPQTLDYIERYLMMSMNGPRDGAQLGACANELNRIQSIGAELNAAVGDEENHFEVVSKDDEVDDFEIVDRPKRSFWSRLFRRG